MIPTLANDHAGLRGSRFYISCSWVGQVAQAFACDWSLYICMCRHLVGPAFQAAAGLRPGVWSFISVQPGWARWWHRLQPAKPRPYGRTWGANTVRSSARLQPRPSGRGSDLRTDHVTSRNPGLNPLISLACEWCNRASRRNCARRFRARGPS
jgi:hypothetical protein